MASWTFSFVFLFAGAWLLGVDERVGAFFGKASQMKKGGSTLVHLRRIQSRLQEVEETLAVGLLPEPSVWESLRDLQAPWGSLTFESLNELRNRGGALLPTLKRLRALAGHHFESLLLAKARLGQAYFQCFTCSILIPVFGFALYELLPGLDEHRRTWLIFLAVALSYTGLGAFWMFSMGESARWGGLRGEKRDWVLAAHCAYERFLALLRSGMPADTAWARCCELLQSEAPGLAERWGPLLWNTGEKPKMKPSSASGLELSLMEAGINLKKAIQISLVEGRPCSERVESAAQSLRQEVQAKIDTELSKLPARALKPLFIFVAPSALALFAGGFFLAWDKLMQ